MVYTGTQRTFCIFGHGIYPKSHTIHTHIVYDRVGIPRSERDYDMVVRPDSGTVLYPTLTVPSGTGPHSHVERSSRHTRTRKGSRNLL